MHDLHLANKIYQLVLDEAKKNRLKKVTKIIIELGSVIEHGEDINPDNLKFNIQALARKSIVADAAIEIKKNKAKIFWKLVAIEGE